MMTPPNREAMVYDLKVLKGLGLNMVRKHVSPTTGRLSVLEFSQPKY